MTDLLPEGATCGDCARFDTCEPKGFALAEETICDWNPSRFKPKAADPHQLPDGMTCADCADFRSRNPIYCMVAPGNTLCGSNPSQFKPRADDPRIEVLTDQLAASQERCRALEREAEKVQGGVASEEVQERATRLWDAGVDLAREITSWQRIIVTVTHEKYQALVEVDHARAEFAALEADLEKIGITRARGGA